MGKKFFQILENNIKIQANIIDLRLNDEGSAYTGIISISWFLSKSP